MATVEEQIASLTPDALRDLARNHAARWEFRKAAAQKLADDYHRHANHPEVAAVIARGGYGEPSESSPECEQPEELWDEIVEVLSQFKASVTTDNLMRDGSVDNGSTD